jgi:hypothetical protein
MQGTECCEKTFGKIGGWVVNKHTQTSLGMLQIVRNLGAIMHIEAQTADIGSGTFSYRKSAAGDNKRGE